MSDPTEAMLPIAAALACAVDDNNRDDVARILEPLDRQQLYALAIVLAAHLPTDEPLSTTAGPDRICVAAIKAAAQAFDTTPEAILSNDRHRHVGDARAVAMTVARRAGVSSPVVGAHFGRDHSTVLHNASRVGETPRLRGAVDRIWHQLYADHNARHLEVAS